MSTIEATTTLGDLVTSVPRAAELLEGLGVDYCCGGRRTLTEACAQHGLDAHTVAVLLNGLAQDDDRSAVDPHDVARSSIAELCDHIVAAHHDWLRKELPATGELAATVVRVHRRTHPDLVDVQRLFAGMRSELEAHMALEERDVFPACRRVEAGAAGALDPALLGQLEDEHADVGDALCALRELSGGYDESRALCGTHRRLMRRLHALELEVHQHVHEENNVLFGKVRARLAAAA